MPRGNEPLTEMAPKAEGEMPDQERIFVGREQELAALKEAIARPEGQMLLAVGGIGFGKTSLLEQLNAELADDERCCGLLYRLNRNDTSENFLARLMGDLLTISDLTKHRLVLNAPRQVERWRTLAKLIPVVGEAASDLIPTDRRPIREQFLEFFHAAAGQLHNGQRLVLTFDPNEYLDDSVEADWASLARTLPAQTTIVFAQRLDDCLARSAGLRRAPNVFRVPDGLRHLGREDSDKLVATWWHRRDAWQRLGDSGREPLQEALWRKYQGYALPLTMALRDLPHQPTSAEHLLEASRALPRDYAEMLRDRYDDAVRLGDDATRVLHALAILQVPATCDRLAALHADQGCQADSLVSACRRDELARCLTLRHRGVVEFFHATMGESVLDQMSDDAKRDLHRRAAGLYEKDLDENKSDKEALDRLPVHLLESDDPGRFVALLGHLHERKRALGMLRSSSRDLRVLVCIFREEMKVAETPAQPQRDLAEALRNLAVVQRQLGEFDDARTCCEEALKLCVHAVCEGDPGWMTVSGRLHGTLASVWLELENAVAARSAFERAEVELSGATDLDEERQAEELAVTLGNYGLFLTSVGEYESARSKLRRARDLLLRSQQSAERDWRLAGVRVNLGQVHGSCEDWEAAEEESRRAADLYTDLQHVLGFEARRGLATALNAIGSALWARHRRDEACREVAKSLELWREIAQTEPAVGEQKLAQTLNNWGVMQAAVRNTGEARHAFDEGIRTLLPWFRKAPSAHYLPIKALLENARMLLEQTGQKPEDWPALVEALKLLAEIQSAEQGDEHDES